MFSGSQRFADALKRLGWRIHCFDVKHGPHEDLSLPAVQKYVMTLIAQADFVHIGLPCNTYSSALRGKTVLRTRSHPFGRPDLTEAQRHKVGVHNELLAFTCRVLRFCRRHKIAVSLENPASSKLWRMPPIAQESRDAKRAAVDYCAFGTRWRKRTSFLFWRCDPLLGLNHFRCKLVNGSCCFSGRPHQKLTGHAPGGLPWTAVAEPYPRRLCPKIAEIVDNHFDQLHLCQLKY